MLKGVFGKLFGKVLGKTLGKVAAKAADDLIVKELDKKTGGLASKVEKAIEDR